MKRVLSLLIWTLCFAMHCMAIPADPRPRSVCQADGSTLVVRQYGDESYHFFATMDGLIVVEDGSRGWYYADCTKAEGMRPSVMMAHNADMRDVEEIRFLNERDASGKTAALQQHITKKWTETYKINNEKRRNRAVQSVLDTQGQYIGKKRGLVVLVEFANLSMVSSTSKQDYDERFNKTDYIHDGHVGSVSDYFRDQSYGKFELAFDVVGPVKLSRNYGYYGTDGTSGSGNDLHADEMVREACCLADPYVNFRDYDWNHDGEADQVYVIYAGYGQATGGASNTIWPHESQLMFYKDGTVELDGTVVNTYACSNELYGEEGELYMGIGTACHEFSHCLGLPDTYDTDYSGAFGMGDWGIMNGGSYNGPNGRAEVPCGYTAFERWYVGWLDMKDILISQRITDLSDLEKHPVAYRLCSENNPMEYYVFENRQGTKWFSYVGTLHGPHGMLVTHIDYDAQAWRDNVVNPTPFAQRMTIIPADGNYMRSDSGLQGDLFPGANEVTVLNNTSHYNAGGKLNHENADGTFTMNASISEIEESDGNISFSAVLNRDLATPLALSATWTGDGRLRFRWSRAVGAQHYDVQALRIDSCMPFKTESYEFFGLTTNFCDLDMTVYHSLLLRVRSRRGSLYSDWSNVVEAESVPESLLQVTTKEKTDIYYNIKGQQSPPGQAKGIIISSTNKKKYFPIH